MKRRNIIGLCIIGTLLLGGLILEVRHVGGFPLRDSLPIEHPHYTASLDSLISHLYGVISGEAGKKRNWDEFRSLFYPSAHLRAAIADTSRGKTGAVLRNMSPEEYIATAGKQLEARGFFEREIHRVTEQFGHVVHLFSTYEARWKLSDEKPFITGINSIQLFHDGQRWWIISIVWDNTQQQAPERYLPQQK